jgi:unsaturated chondroitin disaccharide hydrolase
MEWVSEKSKYKIPYTTIDGTHDDKADSSKKFMGEHGIDWWTNGFWGGMMWLMFHETGDKRYAEIAKYSEEKLDQCFVDYYGLHHDVGFMWLTTAVANYRITKDADARRRGMHAANILAGRFNPVGKFIRAWNDFPGEDKKGWAIIDCMLNIPLLYWASEETGDPRFKQIALLHADTSMDAFIRPDGSVNHIVEFDPFNGGVVKTYGGQGYAEGSSWTRGQSWAIYGFMMSYIHTGKVEYLNTAKRVAHYYIANIPESGIIPVDFRQPAEPAWEDSTSAAIAACGLIEIAKHVSDLEKDMYLNAALKLLKTLDESRCNWSKDCDCILENCTAAYHSEEHHFSIIYGDYYFMEAIFKLKGNDLFLW